MKKKTIGILTLLFCCLLLTASAQNLTKAGALKVNIRSAGPIIQNDQVKGYYFFYLLEKKDSRNYNYMLSVHDENLREINTTTIARPKSFHLIEAAFNGEIFAFMFFDTQSKVLEIAGYDKMLKQKGIARRPVKNKYRLATLRYLATGGNSVENYLEPVDNRGFIFYGMMASRKLHFETEFIDNSMGRVWTGGVTYPTKNAMELATGAFQTEDYIGSIISVKSTIGSANLKSELEVRETASGKEVFRIPLVTEKYSISESNIEYDAERQTFTVFGEYFNKSARELKDRSLGFITLVYDINGNLIRTKTNSWATEISNAAPVNEKGRFDGNNTNILFHKIVRTNDGKTFVVGEQYKKAASAGGIAAFVLTSALGAGQVTSTVQLNVYNMVVFEFDQEYSLTKVYVFDKAKNVLQLPAGYGSLSNRLLSYYAKAVGGFDYVFTQTDGNNETFYVTYVNYDRASQEGKNILGTIVYTPEKTFTVDKLPMQRRANDFYVYRAKEGYIMIVEYFRKERRIESRLEKVNF